MLSSSCDSEVEFDVHITIEARPECTLNKFTTTRLACTLFNTADMHAL